jgi:HD-GYP domain-containing protein (c-di-GMP phosphodiesterase class II)/DNA-binding CsgD family transcriptional regulator
MEPQSPFRFFNAERLDEAASAFGDFADLKSFYTAGHARRVAARSESAAAALRLPDESIEATRRSALLHDVGLVAIPSFVLHKPAERLSEAEWEMLRLHPYHAERILSRAPVFSELRPIVGAHHEQPDGRGFLRGLSERDIPVAARIVAAADRFDELTHEGPGHKPVSADIALEVLQREAGTRLSRDAVRALADSLEQHAVPEEAGLLPSLPKPDTGPRTVWPAGLTDREVDVLRVLSTGASRQAMAKRLSVSEHTVRHHLEHIYAKIDVKTRVEATLFAIEHGLLS